MSSERAFLIAPVEHILIAEPTVESRLILDEDIPGVAHLLVDAVAGLSGPVIAIDDARASIEGLLAGSSGEPLREAWLGVWEVYGAPVSAILCTTWRGIPCIAQVMTAPAARERGYGSSLVREVAQVVQANGGTHLGIMMDLDNPAMTLLAELGFVEMFSTVDA